MPKVGRECHPRGRNGKIIAGSRVTLDTGEVAWEVEGAIRWDLP